MFPPAGRAKGGVHHGGKGERQNAPLPAGATGVNQSYHGMRVGNDEKQLDCQSSKKTSRKGFLAREQAGCFYRSMYRFLFMSSRQMRG